jgi:hypothetical protein
MNKLLLSAAITAALFGGQAQAAVPLHAAPGNNPITTGTGSIYAGIVDEVWISGSSAATPFVEKSVIADCAGTIYKYANSTTDITWICGSSLPGKSTTTNIVHKRDGGGSITGVQSAMGNYPTYAVTSSLDAATCATAVAGISTCTPTALTSAAHVGQIDLADVDGAQFESKLNGNFTGSQKGASLLATKAVATQVFGIAVNTRLRNALLVAEIQSGLIKNVGNVCATITSDATGAVTAVTGINETSEACVPSLTKSQLSAIWGSNRVTDWYNLQFPSTDVANAGYYQTLVGAQAPADVPTNTDVHICSRTAGSGTLATLNLNFENAPCFSGNEAIQATASQTISPETDPLSGNQKVYHSMSGSGDLENCLEGLNQGSTKGTFVYPAVTNGAGPRWAIGVLSLDRNATNAKNYRFIKIDGVSPTAENVVAGKYTFWAELVALGPVPTVVGTLAYDILSNLGSADQITALNAVNTSFGKTGFPNNGLTGFLGTATNPNFLPTYDTLGATGTVINAGFDAVRPVNPWTHEAAVGGSLNHCRVPSIPQGAKSVPALY